ncbi:(2Fe-2S)-binding protein [Amycolatopsis sp. NPDC059090]|uniref:(2Fe-2S)-binding protein n=1 Tax=unclassified Amycolatopsis TaxID=2618356 RepID=UPI00366BB04D
MTAVPESVSTADSTITVNGTARSSRVEVRTTLADHLREELGLTGTKLGCEHGVCGACTVLVDEQPARACLMLAVQADGRSVCTVEGLARQNTLSRLQESFRAHHALQCGFCTAGFLMSATALLADNPAPTRAEVVDALSGNICRCTGYQKIVEAVLHAAQNAEETAGDD